MCSLTYATDVAQRSHLPDLQRQKLYNKIRRCKDTDLKSKLQTEAKSYSKEIKELRKQMKLCNGIEERSKQMEQTISTIQEKERGKNRYERY